MALLSRVTTFVPSTLIQAAQMNSELDQLVDLIGGVSTNKEASIKSSGAPVLTLNNTGGGDIASFLVAGVEKCLVNGAGQFESTIATGTAPLVVASTTEVSNLNAALINGVAGANLLKDNVNNQDIDPSAGNAQLSVTSSDNVCTLRLNEGLGYGSMSTAGGKLLLHSSDSVSGIDLFIRPTEGSLLITNATNHPYPGEVATQPWVTAQAYSTVAAVDARKVVWSKEYFLDSSLWSSSTRLQDVLFPTDTEVLVDRVRYVYRVGSPTGNSSINLVHYNSAGTLQSTYGLTISSTDNQNQVYEINLADFTPAAGDYLRLEPVTNGGHGFLTISVCGYSSLVD